MKVVLAVLAVALVLPGAAFAQDLRAPDQQAPAAAGSRVVAIGTDVAAPDQQSPISTASRLPAIGTDVAAADQQAPVVAAAPSPVSVAASDFDWDDAAVGAIGAALASIALGAAVALRRRRRPSAVAG